MRMSSPALHQRGFAIVESTATASLIGIAFALLSQGAAALMDSVQVSAGAHQFASSLRLAQAASARTTGRTAMCRSSDGESCTSAGGWSQGWIAFHDANGNGKADPGERILERVPALSAGLQIRFAERSVHFIAGGAPRGVSGAPLQVPAIVCHELRVSAGTREIALRIDAAKTGRGSVRGC